LRDEFLFKELVLFSRSFLEMRYPFQLLFLLLSALGFQSGRAQDSANWAWELKSVKTGPASFDLHFKIKPVSGWQLYAPNALISDVPTADIEFSDSAVKRTGPFSTTGNPRKLKVALFDNAEYSIFESEAEFIASITVKGTVPATLNGVLRYNYGKGDEFYPSEFKFETSLEGGVSKAVRIKVPSIDLKNPVARCGGTGIDDGKGSSLWGIFVLGFLGGLIALLTPCVFPMIPLTVSFFTKKAQSRASGVRNALLYGFFIFFIYVLLSLPFHFLNSASPEILNTISTNVWLNLLFFVIFVAFALSFFGLFEITLPSGLANKVDARASMTGGTIGIFFLALTLALVSFSCTGPILGSLLAGSLSSNGGAWQLTSGMAGFGLALALPFALFALFPNWLLNIPNSGGWLTTVKVVLGFIELALAIKFLSNADLVTHWGILKRETFLLIWIIIGLLTVAYLLGWLKFKHDPPPRPLGKFRIAVALVFLAFTLYLVPGLTKSRYANLSILSGFPPPLSYSLYGKNLIREVGLEAKFINDYEGALELARKEHKPVLIDFTGWACVNCRRMEENVWTDNRVKELIDKNYVLVSLYVDDRKNLPIDQQFNFVQDDGDKKFIRTIGDKYSSFQSENFVNVSQPLYVVLNPDEKLLTLPVGYTPNPKEYAEWLNCGLKAFGGGK